MISLQDNFNQVQNRIERACKRVGRDASDVHLIWVSKTRTVEEILAALEIGAEHLGESKVQEVLQKFPLADKNISLHFLGHLQSNKIRKILPLCTTIHSVDSLKLLQQIEKTAQELKQKIDVFLQVNISGEESKFGFSLQGFEETVRHIAPLSQLRVVGLMGIAEKTENPEEARLQFRLLNQLLKRLQSDPAIKGRADLALQFLSMGMSDDFEVAIEEGSHYIRVGTDLFGTR